MARSTLPNDGHLIEYSTLSQPSKNGLAARLLAVCSRSLSRLIGDFSSNQIKAERLRAGLHFPNFHLPFLKGFLSSVERKRFNDAVT